MNKKEMFDKVFKITDKEKIKIELNSLYGNPENNNIHLMYPKICYRIYDGKYGFTSECKKVYHIKEV